MLQSPSADELMQGALGAWLDEQAGLRASVRTTSQRIFGAAVVLAAALTFGVIVAGGGLFDALGTGIGVGGVGYGLSKWVEGPTVTRIKAGMNSAIASSLGLHYNTQVTDRSALQRADGYDLLPEYDDAVLEDEWFGELGQQRFRLHEVRLTEERGSGEKRRTETVFRGCLISVSFARRFDGITVIRRRRSAGLGLVKSLLGLDDTITVAGRSLARINLVDPRFSDSFDAFSSSPVDGHYLLNPAYVDRLIGVEQAFAGDELRAVFAEGELLIALETANLFESGDIDAKGDRDRLERSIAQFTALADLAVQLNERTR